MGPKGNRTERGGTGQGGARGEKGEAGELNKTPRPQAMKERAMNLCSLRTQPGNRVHEGNYVLCTRNWEGSWLRIAGASGQEKHAFLPHQNKKKEKLFYQSLKIPTILQSFLNPVNE